MLEILLILLAIYLLSVAKVYFMFYVSEYEASHPLCWLPVVNTYIGILFACAIIHGAWIHIFGKE